jgi:hypothetical protein
MARVKGALVKRSHLALSLGRQAWLLVYATACLSLLYWPWNLLLILATSGARLLVAWWKAQAKTTFVSPGQ